MFGAKSWCTVLTSSCEQQPQICRVHNSPNHEASHELCLSKNFIAYTPLFLSLSLFIPLPLTCVHNNYHSPAIMRQAVSFICRILAKFICLYPFFSLFLSLSLFIPLPLPLALFVFLTQLSELLLVCEVTSQYKSCKQN